MNKTLTSRLSGALALCAAIAGLSSCGRDVNSLSDPHFAADGAPLDTLAYFLPERPARVRLYVETSGSMNGFLRANQSNRFKRTVWSVFSGLQAQGQTDGCVYTLSNQGRVDSPISIADFRRGLNGGGLLSNSSTLIPDMLASILADIDPAQGEVALLVSDMKYSPRNDNPVELSQYQDDIRNLVGRSGISVSYVCATSEFLGANNRVAEPASPYIFLMLGRPEQVAALRNDIATWVDNVGGYVESGDMAMNYLTPPYAIREVKNALSSSRYPQTLITDVDPDAGDTLSFVLRMDMTGYPRRAMTPSLLDSCLTARALYGATVQATLLTSADHLKDDPHYRGEFERKAWADYQVKVWDFVLPDEVLELRFSSRPFDLWLSADFLAMIASDSPRDLAGLFSFNNFISGCFNGRQNVAATEPIRILLSSANDD